MQTILLRKSAINKNENHNLYLNGRGDNWWCHFTVLEGATQTRIRCSLKTKNLTTAKKIRDNIIEEAQSKGLVTWQ